MEIRINQDGTVSGDLGSIHLKDGLIVRNESTGPATRDAKTKPGKPPASRERKIPIRFPEK